MEMQALERDSESVLEAELKTIADAIIAKAVANVHVLSGFLKSSAYVNKVDKGWAVGFSAIYAPYEEFGTGDTVGVPKGFEDFAMQFKVAGGRKRNGHPHPFLFPAFFEERDKAVEKLTKALKIHFKLS